MQSGSNSRPSPRKHPTAEIATITGRSQEHAQQIRDRNLACAQTLTESAIAKLDQHHRNKEFCKMGLQNGNTDSC
jgi:hypothetical protein